MKGSRVFLFFLPIGLVATAIAVLFLVSGSPVHSSPSDPVTTLDSVVARLRAEGIDVTNSGIESASPSTDFIAVTTPTWESYVFSLDRIYRSLRKRELGAECPLSACMFP